MKKLNFNLKPLAIAVGATALTLASGAVMAQEAGNIDLTQRCPHLHRQYVLSPGKPCLRPGDWSALCRQARLLMPSFSPLMVVCGLNIPPTSRTVVPS